MRSLAARITTVTVALVTLAVMVAVGGAWLIATRVADEAVSDSLAASQSMQRYLQHATAREVALTTDLMSSDPHFTAYLVEAIRGGLDSDQGIDRRSIRDQIDARRREWGFDFAMMLDDAGQVLVRTDRPEVTTESRADHPMVASVMDELVPDYGPWREGSRLYHAAVVPVTTAFELVGFLVSGMTIDNEVAAEIKRVTGVDVVFIMLQEERPSLVASTLDLRRNEQLLAQLPGPSMTSLARGDFVERIDLLFEGESWVARAEPIQDAAGTILGSVLTIDSLDARLAGHRAVQTSLIGAGILAIFIALALSMLIARRIARPVSALAEVADQAAQGDYEQSIDTRGKDEVGTLARAISRLLADLREQKEIAAYVSDLSRHLDEPGSTGQAEETAGEAEPPRSGPALVLALEWRSSKTMTEHQAVEALEQWLPRLAQWARQRHARLVPGGSARIYLIFEPGNTTGLERCLATLLTECEASSSPPAMALANGELISSGIDLDRGRSNLISGKPVFHCERLLTEAGPGRLLLSPAAFQELKDDFNKLNAQLVLSQGLISKRKFYQLISINEVGGAQTETAAMQQPVVSGSRIHVGMVLGGRYDILERVGEGAMGTVFKARDRKLDDVVALKMLKPAMTKDPDYLERMKSEIRLARRITHSNVLRTHDFTEIDGTPVISMEYVRGITLSQLLESSGRLKLAAGLRVCSQVLQGLNAAHQAGVLHRDIKPANIILDQVGNARLMDFGIARQTVNTDKNLTEPGMIVGTANYLAPEVLLGKPADRRSDLYSMGVMMSELFTGVLPIRGETSLEVCMAHIQQEPDAPSKAWPQIPPSLENIILTCLAKDPDRRYPDAEALLLQLIQVRRQSAAATDG